jgi:hypothetical protein
MLRTNDSSVSDDDLGKRHGGEGDRGMLGFLPCARDVLKGAWRASSGYHVHSSLQRAAPFEGKHRRICPICASGASAGGAGAPLLLSPPYEQNTTRAAPCQLSGVATGHNTIVPWVWQAQTHLGSLNALQLAQQVPPGLTLQHKPQHTTRLGKPGRDS